jgi:outer membrane protein assembly factor BamE (lipoprotein component of BamABCDE complex)
VTEPRSSAARPSVGARIAISAIAIGTTTACSTYPFAPEAVAPGEARADVVRGMGPPTATYTLADGRERLEYSRMPFGRRTFMIDLDGAGRVVRWEQVLDETHFQKIVPGMQRADVLRLIGPPSTTGQYHLPRPGITWFYRYESIPKCQWFEVAFDAASGVVLEGDFPPDPACPGEWN